MGNQIVIFEIPPAFSKPIAFNNIEYIRIGSNTTKLQDFTEKERRIWNNIQNKNFEKNIAKENLTSNEVLELLDYSKYFDLTHQTLPSETSKFVERMEHHHLVRRVFENHYDITNLGAILFARQLDTFPSIKRKSIRVIIYLITYKAAKKTA